MNDKQAHLDFMEAQRIGLIMNSAISGAKIDVICMAYALSMGSFAALTGIDPVLVINNIAQRAMTQAYGMSNEPPSVQ